MMIVSQDVYGNGIVESFLQTRGFGLEDVSYLIEPSITHQHHPLLMRDMDEWITELHRVKGETIAVIPDYDADGVLSGTCCRVGLYILGFGDVFVYAPSSFDGYGMTRKSVDAVLTEQPDTQVIITTDNGSNAYDGILYARSKGLDVLVTDHHISHKEPLANVSVNPNKRFDGRVDDMYPFRDISGAAVIYKALQAYMLKYNNHAQVREQISSLILLVGISTVSDMMPLLDENRYFVTESVKMLERAIEAHNEHNKFMYDDTPLGQYYRGIDTLIETLMVNGKLKYGVDADTFGFLIGPILNSPRRMLGTSIDAFDIFRLTKHDLLDDISVLPSDKVYKMNEDRKKYVRVLQQHMIQHVGMMVDITPSAHADESVFTVATRAGIAGLLSGEYSKVFHVPSVAFSVPVDVLEGESPIQVESPSGMVLSGSARSPEWFNLYDFLNQIDKTYPDLIKTWGGHEGAAGISIYSDNFERFKQVFTHHMKLVIADMTKTQQVLSKDLRICDGEYLIHTDTVDLLRQQFPVDLEGVHVVENSALKIIDNMEIYGALSFFSQLEPFGQGFRKPVFSIVIDTSQTSVRYMGADKQHVKFQLGNGMSIIVWNGASDFPIDYVQQPHVYTIDGELGINEFNGRESIQLISSKTTYIGTMN